MVAAIKNTIKVAENSGLTAYAVLGGMRELGGASAHWHREILSSLTAFGKVILLGEEWFDSTIEMPSK